MEEEKVQETTLLDWSAEEFKAYEHNWMWYLLFIIGFIAVIGYSIFARDWFIIGVAVVLAVFLVWYLRKQPQVVNYRVTQLGIYSGENFYPYAEIHSFWLYLGKKGNKLNVIFNRRYLPQLTILLTDLDPLKVKTILGKYLPEQENRTESLVDQISHFLKL